ncbi:hypothetical protein AB1Y20_002725 [Prymnesium parvum]|uniref:Uncharacterized protein n=1 Tax=Prymnesium parvum TaxID=97485 RepID=A0AB34JAC8_PRYPA
MDGSFPNLEVMHASATRLTLVRVVSGNLSFGCMLGTLDGTDTPVTVTLVSHRRQKLLGGWPREGDLVGCEHIVHSVYEPRILLLKEELEAHRFLRRCLPYDITEAYFGIRRPLIRVETQ